MIHIQLAIAKMGKLTLGAILLAAVFVAADTSPYTPWILGCLIPIGLFVVGQLWYAQREKKKEQKEMERRLVTLETQMSPFWATLQTKLADALHHPNPESKEKDGLLEKLENLTITENERSRLDTLLTETASDPDITIEERAKAKMLLLVMPVVTGERHEIIAAAAKVKADAVIESIAIPKTESSTTIPIPVQVVTDPSRPLDVKPIK